LEFAAGGLIVAPPFVAVDWIKKLLEDLLSGSVPSVEAH
jgi:hypothetical protein